MNLERRNFINDIAELIRNALDIKDDNFNIEEIVKKLNGELTFDPLCSDEARVTKSSDDSFKIELDSLDSSNVRRRFTIAHELGHLFLHMKYLIDNSEWHTVDIGTSHARNTNIPYSRLEFEANEFAAAFLMPKDRFIEVAEETSDNNYYYVDRIAKVFDVSRDAAEVRGRVLGIWE